MRGFGSAGLRAFAVCSVVVATSYSPDSQAIRFDWDAFGGVTGTLNTSLSLGAQWRLEERDPRNIGVANLDPTACRSACQPHLSTPPGAVPGRVQLGLEAEGPAVNNAGLAVGGAGGINNDDGNLNFDQYDVTQAVAQITQDLTLEWKDWTFFGRYNAFHDFVNYDREQYYPNYYTPADRAEDDARRNAGEYGFASVGTPQFRENQTQDKYNEFLGQDIDLLDFYVQGYVPVPFFDNEVQITLGEQIINWGESTLLTVNSLNTLNPPNVNALFRPAFLELATVFEPIGALKIAAPLTLNTSFEAFYQYDWEKVEIAPRGAFLSTLDITLDTDNNNINAGFGQVPDDPDGNLRAEQELLTAVAAIDGRVPVSERDAPSGGQYGLAFTWFLPEFNNGTELRFYYANYHSRLPYFSAFAGQESCLQSAPTGETVTDTVNLLADCPNADVAHFLGPALANAGSQEGGLPLGADAGGVLATVAGQIINALPIDQVSTQPNGDPCPADAAPGTGPCGEAYPIDSFRGLLEYPEDIDLFGISFNTSFGNLSVQGEVAYRPNLPLQVDDTDVAFAALQPSSPVGCANGAGANGGSQNRSEDCRIGSFDDRYTIGLPGLGDVLDTVAGGGDLVGALGNLLNVDLGAAQGLVNGLLEATGVQDISQLADVLAPLSDDILLTDPTGRRNAFPDFVTAYRGGEPGNIAPGQYIQGYERFQVFQYNLGATYIIGPGNWIRANQIIMFFELGATHVLGFPDQDELQIEGPGTYYHASVGTDGSGAPACAEGVVQGDAANPDSQTARQANSTLCGQFQGTRFNPRQQRDGYATDFAWGGRIIGIIRYENVLPGISFNPVVILGYDVDGTAPGPGENFIEGREMYVINVEMRYEQAWSLTAGVTFFRGAEPFNLLADRDFFQLGIRYQF